MTMPRRIYWVFAAWVARQHGGKLAPGFIVIPLTEAECRTTRAIRDLPTLGAALEKGKIWAAGASVSDQFIFVEPDGPYPIKETKQS